MVGAFDQYGCCGRCLITKDDCEFIIGNTSKEIDIDENIDAHEIRADIEVKRGRFIRLCGQVKDSNGDPVKFTLIKLAKELRKDSRLFYKCIGDSITDYCGFYQFDIYVPDDWIPVNVRVFVSKQSMGKEIDFNKNECNSCEEDTEQGTWIIWR